jgi:D-ribose pyranose/furanose isomerase RbsD
MHAPSIQELASRARDISKYQEVPMLNAIRIVAEEYSVSSTIIAQELARRSVSIKRQRKNAKDQKDEESRAEELERIRQEKLLSGAYRHEAEMKAPFVTTGHLDDY